MGSQKSERLAERTSNGYEFLAKLRTRIDPGSGQLTNRPKTHSQTKNLLFGREEKPAQGGFSDIYNVNLAILNP